MGAPIESPYPGIEVPPGTLTDHVFAQVHEHPDRPALVDGASGRTYSYAELQGYAERCAAGLTSRGLEPGQTVALFAPNVPEYAIAYYGVALAGGTNTTVNALLTAEELAHQLRDSRARVLITAPPLLDRALPAAESAGIADVYVFGDAAGALPFRALLESNEPAPRAVADPAAHVVTLPYSSGTTGLPKGVMLTHRNLVAQLQQVAVLWPLAGEDECAIAALPLFHIYGQTLLMHHCLRAGASVVTMPRFDLVQYLELSERHRATVAWVVPPIMLALAKDPAVGRFDLSSLRWIMSGAAPLDAELQVAVAARLRCKALQGYGLTEASPVTHGWGEHADEVVPGTIGPLIPSTEARVVDIATGEDVAPGEPGEVWVRGPQVMAGYLDNPQATALTVDSDGWLHTGDIAAVSRDGIFTIVDRLKEMIKVKGYQVAPAELEGVLLAHPSVADACVIPVPDEESGELPKAYVVPAAGVAVTAAEIVDYVAARVAPYKRIRACELIDAIPKSPSGKLLRRALVERERAARLEA
jgi:acyl-CoA synthetase (AMP-forming)/AMP-acid ligase II